MHLPVPFRRQIIKGLREGDGPQGLWNFGDDPKSIGHNVLQNSIDFDVFHFFDLFHFANLHM